MYWAVTSQKACAGIEVTASHNPIDYNGMKIVKRGSEPLSDEEFQAIRSCAEGGAFTDPLERGARVNIEGLARQAYVEKLMQFVAPSALKPLKIVVNAGNGAAGPVLTRWPRHLKMRGARQNLTACITHPIEFSKWHSKPAFT